MIFFIAAALAFGVAYWWYLQDEPWERGLNPIMWIDIIIGVLLLIAGVTIK